jgi:uncharacterized protein involved in exopolysaccharide biosynthesis
MSLPAPSPLFRLLMRRWWLALLVMGLSFVLFGAASVNLLQVLGANLRFLVEHGGRAVQDGALGQLVELIATGYFAAGCYVVFKVCEKALVERVTHIHKEE